MVRVGLIGCGRMSGALLGRWLASGTLRADDVQACTSRLESAAEVTATFDIACGTDPAPVVAWADVVVLGIKPQQLRAVQPSLTVRPGQLWLSLLAGVTTAQLETMLPGARVVRCMPNTPVRLGLGLTGLCAGRTADAAAVDLARQWFEATGEVRVLAETEMNAFTAIAGCGPAYAFLFLEALARAAEGVGFEASEAAAMAAQVTAGALALARVDGRSAAVLRAEVTSKGGMTEAALTELAAHDWLAALVEAVQVARERGAALAEAAETVASVTRKPL